MSEPMNPGDYVVQQNAFSGSVVELASAVPAFVGFTERAEENGRSLRGVPWRIGSMADFERHFGGAPPAVYSMQQLAGASSPLGGATYALMQAGARFRLYHGLRHYFMNGGGACHIVSVADFSQGLGKAWIEQGLAALERELAPTLLVVPDAVSLPFADCIQLQSLMLAHCARMGHRFAILDVPQGDVDLGGADDPVEAFRQGIGSNRLAFGAAYYPFLDTTVVEESELDLRHLDAAAQGVLFDGLRADPAVPSGVKAMLDLAEAPADLHPTLMTSSSAYKAVFDEIRRHMNRQGPSAALAGIYTLVDTTQGVWKAPANVSVAGVVKPAVAVNHALQVDLNVTPQGKSINALRLFVGEGVLVWGARTLDGNSLDWRYINVRRTMSWLEQNCKQAAQLMVSERNEASTWVALKALIDRHLTSVWERGGLAGAVSDDAFSVHCGLGDTMTPGDVLEGILRVTVLVAISRPAEYIEITFQQQQQQQPLC